MNPMRVFHHITQCSLVLATVLACSSQAHGATFGLLGKSMDDPNFVAAWRGCNDEARRNGDACVLLGNRGSTDARLQALALDEALQSRQYAALAISVTASELIANAARSSTIPLITFDSPFSTRDAALGRAYIGIDNVAFGRELARTARRLRPQGGSLCLMTAANNTNLAQRIAGVRQELSGKERWPEGQRLTGENSWIEQERCPWNTGDIPERTMREVELTFSTLKPDVFLSVGHWPVIDAVAYRAIVEPYRDALLKRQPAVVIATGTVGTPQAALLDEKRVHGYVSINFEQIGRSSYRAMRALVDGKPPGTTVSNSTTVHLVK